MKSNEQILKEVQSELRRFTKKLNEALKASETNKFAAAKRSAMDLKMELTKLTQSSKYKYGRH